MSILLNTMYNVNIITRMFQLILMIIKRCSRLYTVNM